MKGRLSGRQNFPAWLGKNSTTLKNKRLLGEIRDHMQNKISASLKEVRLQYLPSLKKPLIIPLQEKEKEGIFEVIVTMEQYGITKEDWNSIFDICQWSCFSDPVKMVPSKVKSSFTREYNKGHITIKEKKTKKK